MTTPLSTLFCSSNHSQLTAPVGLKSPPRLTIAKILRAVRSGSSVSLTMIVPTGKVVLPDGGGGFQYTVSGKTGTPPSAARLPASTPSPPGTLGKLAAGIAGAEGQA